MAEVERRCICIKSVTMAALAFGIVVTSCHILRMVIEIGVIPCLGRDFSGSIGDFRRLRRERRACIVLRACIVAIGAPSAGIKALPYCVAALYFGYVPES